MSGLLEHVSVSDEGRGQEVGLGPEIGGEETVSVQEGIISSSDEVFKSLG
jgi:hypothetical protein